GPLGNRVPEGGTPVEVTSAHLSLPFTVKLTTASHRPGWHGTLMSPGQVICGFSISTTSTPNEQRLLLWFTSEATQSTIVWPTPTKEPLAGMQSTRCIAQLSVARTS